MTIRWLLGAMTLLLASCASAPPPTAPEGASRHVLQYSHDGWRGQGLVRLIPVRTFADSVYRRAHSAFSTDDDTNTQWASGGYQEPEGWLALEFPRRARFDEIEIKTGRFEGDVTYRIEASHDGYRWRPLTHRLRPRSWQVERLRVSGEGRFLRVHFFNSPTFPAPRFAVFELSAFGTEGGWGYPRRHGRDRDYSEGYGYSPRR